MNDAGTGKGESQAGFTLIELLMALAIFTLVLGGVYRSFHVGMAARDRGVATLTE